MMMMRKSVGISLFSVGFGYGNMLYNNVQIRVVNNA